MNQKTLELIANERESKRYVEGVIKSLFNDGKILEAWDATFTGISEFFDVHANCLLKLKYDSDLYWYALCAFIYEFAKEAKLRGKSLKEFG